MRLDDTRAVSGQRGWAGPEDIERLAELSLETIREHGGGDTHDAVREPAASPPKEAESPPEAEEPVVERSGTLPSHYEATDLGAAEAFVDLFDERFRHVRERRAWLVWEGGRWRRDTTGAVERAAKETARALLRRAAELDGEAQKRAVGWALACQAERRITAMLALASTETGVALAADALDRNPFLLACANGTLDLRTGLLRPHTRPT